MSTSMDPRIVSAIEDRLKGIKLDEGVQIPWAIESGSRAWGFPSPDSDYDCRFIYVRRREEYLSLWPKRDVIETPLDEIYDVNGWDISKAIRLMAKGNATVVEWLRSPIVYSGDGTVRDRLLDFAYAHADRSAIGRHYFHVALQQQERPTNLKRFFYVLRPAVALRWLDVHSNRAVPPMELPTLMSEADMDPQVRSAVDDLIRLKAETREMGHGTLPPILVRFVRDQLTSASRFQNAEPTHDLEEMRGAANELFRSLVA